MEILPGTGLKAGVSADGSIDQIIETYKSTVYGIALTRLRNRYDADDVFQDVFLTYYRKQPRFNGEEHRKAWLIKVTMLCTRKCLRQRQLNTVELTEELAGEEVPFQALEDTKVYAALLRVPEKYRTVMYLHYFEGLSADEISEVTKLRPGTVRMQLSRGRDFLWDVLEGGSFENDEEDEE